MWRIKVLRVRECECNFALFRRARTQAAAPGAPFQIGRAMGTKNSDLPNWFLTLDCELVLVASRCEGKLDYVRRSKITTYH